MPIKVKDETRSGSKWVGRSQAAAPDYAEGINEANDWEQRTIAGTANYKAGLTQSFARGAFPAGVRRAGNEKWKRKSAGPGADRYGPGVAAAEADYVAGVTKYFSAMRNFSLPKGGPRGSAMNFQRSQALGQMLNKLRTGSGGGGTIG